MAKTSRLRVFSYGLVLVAAMACASLAKAQSDTIVVAELFAPKAGWALETDDAFVLTKAGCMEMLARVDFDGSLKPSLAVSWTQSSPTSWDFTLRPGVMFQDGRKLDADAVVGALNNVLRAAAPARSFSPRFVTKVEALSLDVVRISTPAPSVLVPFRLASPNTGILSPAAYAGGKVNPLKACTGPYAVVEEIPRQLLKLERNAAYWGDAPGYAKAEIRFIPDGAVRGTMAHTGEAQSATSLPVTSLRDPGPKLTVMSMDLPRITSLYLNTAKPPFNDVRVRQAIQAAIDTKAIAASVYEGLAKPAVGPFVPGAPWTPTGAAPVTQDLGKARALLAAAGIAPGSLKIELLAYAERPELPDLAAVLQAELAEAGIPVTIRVAAYAALEPDLLSGNYQAMLLSRSHLIDVADPSGFLIADYTCKGGYALSHFCDPALDAKLDATAAVTDPAQRYPVYAEIAARLQSEAVSVFLIREQQRDAVSVGVRNYRTHPMNHYTLTAAVAPAVK
jgi:peptide/nickel transport system substrate-binding protein